MSDAESRVLTTNRISRCESMKAKGHADSPHKQHRYLPEKRLSHTSCSTHTHTLEQQQQLLGWYILCVCVCVSMLHSTFLPFPNISAERKVHLLIMHSANERSPPLDIQYAGNVNSCCLLKRCFQHADVSGGCSFLLVCSRNIKPSVAVAGYTRTHTQRRTCRNPGTCWHMVLTGLACID